ncbi:MAG: conjugal transfer protein TraN [Ignisphaera sp.]
MFLCRKRIFYKFTSIFSILLLFINHVFFGFFLFLFLPPRSVLAEGGSCGEPTCFIPEELKNLSEQPIYDPSIGYCTHNPISQLNCVSPYVFHGMYQKCIAYPKCGSECYWNTNTNRCEYIYGENGTLIDGGTSGSGGSELPNLDGPICGRDINNDGELEAGEIRQCVTLNLSNGTSYQLCPLDIVECEKEIQAGRCPEGTVLEKDTGLCVADASVTCPEGFSYDQSLEKCVSPPYCPPGSSFDLQLDKCVISLSSFCPEGYVYDQNIQGCVKDADCTSGGIYNPDTYRCELLLTYNCPQGSSFNPSTKKCETDPICLNGGVYNPSTKRCELSVVLSCPSGTVYNSSTNKCESTPTCPSNFNYSSSIDKCIKSATISCPPGFSYNSSTNKCEASPTCPTGGSYNPSTNRCEAGAITTCPSGSSYNSSTGKCEANVSIICPSGSSYNYSTGKCEANPTQTCSPQYTMPSCPSGYSYSSSQNKCVATPQVVCEIQKEFYYPSYTTTVSVVVNQDYQDYCAVIIYSDGNPTAWEPVYIMKNCSFFTYAIGIGYYFDSVTECDNYSVTGKSRDTILSRQLTCPSGGSLSGSQCIATPICPPGTTLTSQGCYSQVCSISCPSGMSYNSNTQKCESTPQYSCPSGMTYNSSTRKCEAVPQFSCPSGYSLQNNICIAGASCPSGSSLNTVIDKCETSVVYQCPSGSTYDSTIKMCVASPSCPTGTSLNGSTDKCEAVPLQSCPSGYSLSGDICIASVKCPSGFVFNKISNKCEATPSISCPSGYRIEGSLCVSDPICTQGGVIISGKCVISANNLCPQGFSYINGTNMCGIDPQCFQGGQYSIVTDLCVVDPNYNCPIGSYYNPENKRCEAYVECPEGQEYNTNLGGCDSGTWACPWGPNRPCVEYEGKLVCSPHDCETPSSGDEDEPPSGLEDDAEYKDDVCTGTIYIFTGKKMRCRPSGLSTGFHNCCDEAKGKLYDSFGSTGMGLVDGIKAIYAAMSLVKFASALTSATTIKASLSAGGEIVSYSLYNGDKLLATVAKESTEGLAITTMLQTQALDTYNQLQQLGEASISHISTAQKLEGAMQGYAMSPQVMAAIINIALTQAISDPILSATADLAYQLILLKLGIISGPMAVVAIALAVIKLAMALFTPRCDQQDILTSTYKESGYCHYVGSRCIKKILGKCVQKSKVYCCFNSKLARIIHEQGRPQLVTFGPDGGWGSAKSPNCRGFTPEEFQAIDFGRIDFSEYIEDVQRSVRQNIEPQLKSLFEGTMNQILKQ